MPARPRSTRPTTTSSTRATSARRAARFASRPPTSGSPRSARRSARSRAGSARTGSSRMRLDGDESLRPRGWAGKLWSPAIGVEHRACREAVAIFDESSFAKIDVSGEGAAAFLESLCANRVAREIGAVTYTQMLNERGGIECDFTVTRLAEERFRIVTGTAFGQHDLAWIRQHAPARRVGAHRRRDVGARVLRRLGAERARAAAAAHDDGSGERRVRLHAGAGALDRRRPVPRGQGHLRRRARLGAVLPVRVRRAAVGHRSGPPVRSTASSPADTRRSTRSGSRRATASGVPTSRPRTRRSRPVSALP